MEQGQAESQSDQHPKRQRPIKGTKQRHAPGKVAAKKRFVHKKSEFTRTTAARPARSMIVCVAFIKSKRNPTGILNILTTRCATERLCISGSLFYARRDLTARGLPFCL